MTRILAIALILGCFTMAVASAATPQGMVDDVSTARVEALARPIFTPPTRPPLPIQPEIGAPPVASESAGQQVKLAATQGPSYPRPIPGWGGPKPPRHVHVQTEGVNDIRAD